MELVEHWWNGGAGGHREDVIVRRGPEGTHEVELRVGARSIKREYRTRDEAMTISDGLRAVGVWLELSRLRNFATSAGTR
ncbi:MAG: hypothetical protein HOU81_18695 [Hamadaea sp.]|uniref:hypothetical protein n=1 Tax=Hamadaea sp. TaxID=2024425 RepID=UPI00181A02C5|nr:hypothetical protein [Hamadaea sp.]NUR72847.1 hypothetical protein [Hamadaea sp.]NUT20614.1 hypothetical protein [Hamadaea sp.]